MNPTEPTSDDTELAGQFRRGDESAFTELYQKYVAGVHDYVARTVRDTTAAEDITQAAFVRAYERRETLRDPAMFRGWMYRIAANLALNHVTRSKPTDDIEAIPSMAAPGAGPEDQAVSNEMAELVWSAAASLEPRQYTVLDLTVRHDVPTAEIATLLGVDTGQAALLVHRAKEALGNAVCYLLVARRRTHCDRLAEMVPAGVRQLSTDQRASVDRHMRRCENCRDMARTLTQSAELFGGLAVLPVPARLTQAPAVHGAAAPHPGAGAVTRRVARLVLQHKLIALGVAATIAAGSVGVVKLVARPQHSANMPFTVIRPAGPYATLAAAEHYVSEQAAPGFPFSFLQPGSTWRAGAMLHALWVTPQNTASYGGDQYFFFANGYAVGRSAFLHGSFVALNSDIVEIQYESYSPGDAACCPSGGKRSVRFQWIGSRLVTLDPIIGPT